MGAISPIHLLIVLVVALIVIGPRKLPETGAAIGSALRELRLAMRDEPTAATVPTEAAAPTQATAMTQGHDVTPGTSTDPTDTGSPSV